MFDTISKYSEYLEKASLFSYPISLFLGFLAGMAAITCYLPIIPVLIGFIGGQDISKKKLFTFPLFVMLGSIIMLGSLGVVVSFFGMTIQNYIGSSWKYLVGFICILVGLLMLKMLPMPKIKLPEFKYKGFWASLLFGIIMGVVIGFGSSCCTPTLPIILTYAGIQGKPLHGGLILATFAIGQSIPIFAIGLFSSTLGKITAKWSFYVQKVSGVLLLAVGFYFIIWR
ncbi:MAG: hypothetical protein N2645_19845 [Clostridia bacterium]|nr:hypothetical protein [Clostridia bacterium]